MGTGRAEAAGRIGMIGGTGCREWADDDGVDPEATSDVGGPGVVAQKELGTGDQVDHLQGTGLAGH